jgi:hypothetical protein
MIFCLIANEIITIRNSTMIMNTIRIIIICFIIVTEHHGYYSYYYNHSRMPRNLRNTQQPKEYPGT